MDSPSDSSRFVVGVLLVLFGMLAAGIIYWRPRPPALERDEPLVLPPTRVSPEERLRALQERVARAPDGAKREPRVELPKLPAARHAAPPEGHEPPPAIERARQRDAAGSGSHREQQRSGEQPQTNPAQVADYSTSGAERILADLGVDATKLADLRRRVDELVVAEAQLRQDAQREGWLNSPEFSDELDALEAERQSIRDEIGDEAYDHFLFASGEMNRVLVTGVEQHSPADVAGLRAGDLILRYDGVRIFAPNDLLAEIDAARAGNVVRLDVMRQGNPIQVEISDGPLGITFEATQDRPAPPK